MDLGLDKFVDVGLCFEQVVEARLLTLVTSSADVLDNIAFQEV
jgi:hypothetical protein